MNPAIETRELCYTYEDGTAALDHVSLKAERGRITGILGANGAGKSTLFLNLNGVLTPQSGEVLLDGAPVRRDRKGLAELRRRVGIVFQDPDDQLFSADVYRDISFGAVNLGLPEAEVRRRVEAAMERTGVSALRDKPTHALSFGQKKRAAIAGVLVMEPEVLILDEPTAGLDPRERVRFRNLIHALSGERIVILSTHIVSDIETIAGQIVMFRDHRLYCCDSPARICARFQGRVFQLPAGMPLAPGQFLLSEGQGADGPVLRVLCETPPVNGTPVTPGLEDAFLAIYREEQT